MIAKINLDVELTKSVMVPALAEQAQLTLEDAAAVVRHCIRAEQSGKHDHGLMRVPYIAKLGPFLPAPDPELTGPGRVHVDGRGAVGLAVIDKIMPMVCSQARHNGFCILTAPGTSPSGAMGDWAGQAATNHETACLLFAGSRPHVAMLGESKPRVGTNPLVISFPTKPVPFVADVSFAATTNGEVMRSKASGTPLPEGVAVDFEGRPTTNAKDVMAILPLAASHKAFAALLAIQVIASMGGRPGEPGVFGMFISRSLLEPWLAAASHWLAGQQHRIPGWESAHSAIEQQSRNVVAVPLDTFKTLADFVGRQSAENLIKKEEILCPA